MGYYPHTNFRSPQKIIAAVYTTVIYASILRFTLTGLTILP